MNADTPELPMTEKQIDIVLEAISNAVFDAYKAIGATPTGLTISGCLICCLALIVAEGKVQPALQAKMLVDYLTQLTEKYKLADETSSD